MYRALIAYVVCCVLALVSVSGAHFHAHLAQHEDHVSAASDHDHAYRDDHDDDHDLGYHDDEHEHEHHRGAVDVERESKAFGLTSIDPPAFLVALCVVLLDTTAAASTSTIPFPPPLRPPRDRSRFHLFPPSHAPPALLS